MPKPSAPFDIARSLQESYAVNERINQYLLENLPDAAWSAEPQGGKRRTRAAVAAHMHNVRHMWRVAAAKGAPLPDKTRPRGWVRKWLSRTAASAVTRRYRTFTCSATRSGNRRSSCHPQS